MAGLITLLVGGPGCKANNPLPPLDLGVTLTTSGTVAALYKACDRDGGFVTVVSLYQLGPNARRDDRLIWRVQAEASPLLLRDIVVGREPLGYETLQPLTTLPDDAPLRLEIATSDRERASVLRFATADLNAEDYLLANGAQISRDDFKALDSCATKADVFG